MASLATRLACFQLLRREHRQHKGALRRAFLLIQDAEFAILADLNRVEADVLSVDGADKNMKVLADLPPLLSRLLQAGRLGLRATRCFAIL